MYRFLYILFLINYNMVDVNSLEFILRQYIVYVATGISSAFAACMYRIWKCLQAQDRRAWRQSQAFMLLVELLDDQTEDLHPNEKKHDIKDKIQRLLEDQDGKF